jgi:hypothetical protein
MASSTSLMLSDPQKNLDGRKQFQVKGPPPINQLRSWTGKEPRDMMHSVHRFGVMMIEK